MWTEKDQNVLECAYFRLSEITSERCGNCPGIDRPQRCCEPFYCEVTALFQLERYGRVEKHATNQQFPGLIYLGENGCVVPPHLRPHCTMHDCHMKKKRDAGEPPETDFEIEFNDLHDAIERMEERKAVFRRQARDAARAAAQQQTGA